MKSKKVKLYLFYKEKAEPDVQEFDFINKYHLGQCLQGILVIGDEENRFAFLSIAYLNGKFWGFATTEQHVGRVKIKEKGNGDDLD